MSYSFAGTTISIRAAGQLGDEQQLAKHVHHIPGGNVNYYDNGGLQERVITHSLIFSSLADYNTFRALVGTSGTLISILGTIDGATLDSCRLEQIIWNNGAISKVFAEFTWTIP